MRGLRKQGIYEPIQQWNNEEDDFLRSIVPKQRRTNWTLIEKSFNFQFPNHFKSSKQLRDRYTNHSRFQKKANTQNQWGQVEIKELFGFYLVHGAKWTQLSGNFEGRYSYDVYDRSENSLKNKFYGTIRKLLRKINSLSRQVLPSYTKQLKYDAFVRVLEVQDSQIAMPEGMLKEAKVLRAQIIGYCQSEISLNNPEQFINFMRSLHGFNLKSRCYRLNKSKNRNTSTCHDPGTRVLTTLNNGPAKIFRCPPPEHESNSMKPLPSIYSPTFPTSGAEHQEKTSPTCFREFYKRQQQHELKFVTELELEGGKIREEEKLEFQVCQILGITYISGNNAQNQLFGIAK